MHDFDGRIGLVARIEKREPPPPFQASFLRRNEGGRVPLVVVDVVEVNAPDAILDSETVLKLEGYCFWIANDQKVSWYAKRVRQARPHVVRF
jgi:hypothetical protein